MTNPYDKEDDLSQKEIYSKVEALMEMSNNLPKTKKFDMFKVAANRLLDKYFEKVDTALKE